MNVDPSRNPLSLLLATLLLAAWSATPAMAAGGFSLDLQGGKAAGLGGAFVAQADDPTALFHNPGGLALLEKKKGGALGFAAFRLNEALYQGLAPGLGQGTTGEQDTPFLLPAHVFVILPFQEKHVIGVGIYQPYQLSNVWGGNKAAFAGRRIALRSEITTIDINPTASFQLGATVGLGVGFTYRTAEISSLRRVSRLNPFNGQLFDAASLDQTTDMEGGFGGNLGFLHRPSERFSWGLSYRSAIEIDFNGVGKLTQIPSTNPQLDELVANTLPFGQELALGTTLEFPASAKLGVAIGLTAKSKLEIDAGWTAWSSVERLDFQYLSNPELDQSIPLLLEDSMSYHLGLNIGTPTGFELRVGYAFEETPQPDLTVGPFWADTDRSTATAGIGLDWLDLAFAWINDDQRIVTTSTTNINGNWRRNAYMLVVTLKQ